MVFSRLLRSPANVNLWRIPLMLSVASVALFGITVGIDALDATGKIHLPVWLTMGGIDDARAILSAMLGCGEHGARAHLLGRASRSIDGGYALRAAPPLSVFCTTG